MTKHVSEIICIVCPLACRVSVAADDERHILEVDGFQCKKGKEYAVAEYRSPMRVLTTTVIATKSRHALLPVRTNRVIPRGKLINCMNYLAKIKVKPPLKAGDVIVRNILNLGSDIIAVGTLLD
jgi:CxxC motif-containing protein